MLQSSTLNLLQLGKYKKPTVPSDKLVREFVNSAHLHDP